MRCGATPCSTISSIEDHMVECYETLICTKEAITADIHRGQLEQFREEWKHVRSTDTCFSCIRRRPQYNLPCNHSFCENCILVLGERDAHDPWVYKITQCWLCGVVLHNVITVRVQPPTAGVSVLCIDGGGARGIIPLQLLKRIQDTVGLPMPLQRFFQMAFGISSGTLPRMLGRSIDVFRWPHSTSTFRPRAKHRKFLGVVRRAISACFRTTQSAQHSFAVCCAEGCTLLHLG